MDNRGLPNRAWLASSQHRLACCAIAKNGCTTLKKWFLSFADPAGLTAPDVHIYCAPRWMISLWEGPPRDEAFAKFYTMAFLRDPLSRVASAYVEKFVGGHPYGYFEPAREVLEDLARMRGIDVQLDHTEALQLGAQSVSVPASSAVDYVRGATFREFVSYLCAAPDDHLDQHWRPQSSFIAGRRMSFLGRVSSMTAALGLISERLGFPPPPTPEQLPRASPDGGFIGDVPSSDLYRRFIYDRAVLPATELLFDDEIRSMLRHRFATDIEIFQRSTDLPSTLPDPVRPSVTPDTIHVDPRETPFASSRT
jgi:hypothetical protein